jgi:hypothetical protein
MTGYFGVYGMATYTPPSTYTFQGVTYNGLPLIDIGLAQLYAADTTLSETGQGDGSYTVTFAWNEQAVYGPGNPQFDGDTETVVGPALHVCKRTKNNAIASPYDPRVHKLTEYLVVNGLITGQRDVRIMGASNSDLTSTASTTATGNSTASNVTSVGATAPLASSGGLTPVISIASPIPVADGGTGTATPALVAGTGITIAGVWPDNMISSTGSGVSAVTASAPLSSTGGGTPNISLSIPLPIADGGTGTATPALVAGTGITLSGAWPDTTISASASGSTTLGTLTDIDFTTLGPGKVLAAVASSGKPYSFIALTAANISLGLTAEDGTQLTAESGLLLYSN